MHFGFAGTGKDGSPAAFPKVRVVTVGECASHAEVAAALGPVASKGSGEQSLARQLYPRLREDAWRELSGYHHPADPIGPEPVAAAPTCGPPGTRPSPPSALPTGPTSAACPTGYCCTCATPIRSKPPGHPSGSATSCARFAPPHGMRT